MASRVTSAGQFVRFGPNRIAINSNTALRDIYGFQANVQKSPIYGILAEFMGGFNVHLSINKEQHAFKKRVMSHAFSDHAMAGMEDHIISIVDKFTRKVTEGASTQEEAILSNEKPQTNKRWSKAKNMADWSDYLTFDIMGTLCFGKSFGMLDTDTNRYILDTLREATGGLHTVAHMPFLLRLRINKLLFGRVDRSMTKMKAYCEAQASERIKNDNNVKIRDFYTYLLQAKDPETGLGFTHPELAAEAGLLMIAGSDTSAVAISSTLFYLLHNPLALDQLTREIRSTFADADDIRSGSSLNSCVYLRACIDEAMRFSPPTGGILSREVLEGGITIDGHYFPKGIEMGTPHYALHHNEQYFPDSFTYKPNRWLVDSESEVTSDSVQLARSAFCAFSMGPRGCLGKGMAYREISIALGRLVWMYDMRLAQGTNTGQGNPSLPEGRRRPEEYQLFDVFASKAHGPMVEFSPRSD
ncbi:hypothetical protein ACLMJK_001596 [Lecanora helva]